MTQKYRSYYDIQKDVVRFADNVKTITMPISEYEKHYKEIMLAKALENERQHIYDHYYYYGAITGRVSSTPKISDKEQKLTSHIRDVIKHLRDYCITLQSVADTTLSRGEKRAAEDKKIRVNKLVDDLEKLK